jgi:hypothetical protein
VSVDHLSLSSAELEAFYRFINCAGFSAADVVASNISSTLALVKAQKCSIAIRDSTTFEYSTERSGTRSWHFTVWT